MSTARALLLLPLAASCASAAVAPETIEPRLVEPRGHRPPPDLAELPRDIKHLGAMTPRWSVDGGPWATIGPDAVYQVVSTQGILRALDLMRGETVWSAPVPGVSDPTLPPVFSGGHVIVPTAFGLRALTPGGAIAWQWTGAVKGLRGDDAHLFLLGAPEGDRLQLLLLDGATGAPRWAKPCAATCDLLDQRGDALLVRTRARRVVRFDGPRLTVTATAAGAVLTSDGVLGLSRGQVNAVGPSGARRFSRTIEGAGRARLGRAGDAVLLSYGDRLIGLDPRTGADRWSIEVRLGAPGVLRPDLARAFPEGELLVPSEERFGLVSVYLLVRDDGTLRAVRYGHPRLSRIDQRGALALYASADGLVLSGTRRRGSPIRHFETLEQDVDATLDRLARDPFGSPADGEAVARAQAWLRRLGPEAYRTRWLAKLSTTPPERLGGLVTMLTGEPQDAAAWAHTVRGLAVAPTGPGVASARALALSVPRVGPLPDDVYPGLRDRAPAWLSGLDPSVLGLAYPTIGLLVARPPEATVGALTVAAIRRVADEAASRGDHVGLQRALQARLGAGRGVCPWPEALTEGPRPVAPRCPLTVPPPTARFDDAQRRAEWTAGWAGQRGDRWQMRRDGDRWGPPRLLGGATAAAAPKDRDGDGLDDRLEVRLGLNPRRADTDGDGLDDAADPAPTCPGRPTSDGAEAVRRALAAQRFALTLGTSVVRDASRVCLPIAVAAGPVVVAAASTAPDAPWFAVDRLPTDQVEALLEGRAGAFEPEAWLGFSVRGPDGQDVVLYRRVEGRWHQQPREDLSRPMGALDLPAAGR